MGFVQSIMFVRLVQYIMNCSNFCQKITNPLNLDGDKGSNTDFGQYRRRRQKNLKVISTIEQL